MDFVFRLIGPFYKTKARERHDATFRATSEATSYARNWGGGGNFASILNLYHSISNMLREAAWFRGGQTVQLWSCATFCVRCCIMCPELKIPSIPCLSTSNYHLLPSSFLNLFTTNNLIHSHNTRRATDYRPHVYRTNVKSFTILFQGPKAWNSLPKNVINSETLSCFRKRLFNFLLNQ